jgi:hypothetical protein
MAPLPQNRVIASDRVVTRVVNGGTVLLNADTGRYFSLDAIGSRVWEALISSPSIGAAEERLSAEYDVERSALLEDVNALIASLVEQGLAEVVGE